MKKYLFLLLFVLSFLGCDDRIPDYSTMLFSENTEFAQFDCFDFTNAVSLFISPAGADKMFQYGSQNFKKPIATHYLYKVTADKKVEAVKYIDKSGNAISQDAASVCYVVDINNDYLLIGLDPVKKIEDRYFDGYILQYLVNKTEGAIAYAFHDKKQSPRTNILINSAMTSRQYPERLSVTKNSIFYLGRGLNSETSNSFDDLEPAIYRFCLKEKKLYSPSLQEDSLDSLDDFWNFIVDDDDNLQYGNKYIFGDGSGFRKLYLSSNPNFAVGNEMFLEFTYNTLTAISVKDGKIVSRSISPASDPPPPTSSRYPDEPVELFEIEANTDQYYVADNLNAVLYLLDNSQIDFSFTKLVDLSESVNPIETVSKVIKTEESFYILGNEILQKYNLSTKQLTKLPISNNHGVKINDFIMVGDEILCAGTTSITTESGGVKEVQVVGFEDEFYSDNEDFTFIREPYANPIEFFDPIKKEAK